MSLSALPRAWGPGGTNWRSRQGLARKRPTSVIDPAWHKTPITNPAIATPFNRPEPVGLRTKPVDPLLGRANSVAESMFAPLFQKLGAQRAAAEANARSAYGTHATALENALKTSGAAIPAAFDTAIGQSAKVNEAVANRLQGVGNAEGQSLAAKLAQISADPAQAAELSKFYQGAGNTEFAHGGADLSSLIGRRGEAAAYQGKLPGIGRLAANQGLESALSEFRGEFAGQEADLRSDALQEVSGLYKDYRAEKAQATERKAQEKADLLDRAQKDRATLRALQATATTAAEKAGYIAQEKAMDRQLKWDIASLNANTRLATDNPPAAPKPGSVTGPANQKFITVNGKKVKNPNYAPSESGNDNDSWLTPGSAKREKIVSGAWGAVVSPEGGWNGAVLRRLQKFPNSADAIINTAINQAMRARGITNPNHPSAKQIRQAIRQRLSGRTWKVKDYDEPFTFLAG